MCVLLDVSAGFDAYDDAAALINLGKITMNKMTIITLATTAALVYSPASAAHIHGDRPEFSTLDINGDGKITKTEVQAYGKARFASVDADGNGSLSVEELTTRMSRRLLKHLDANGNGAVELSEMQVKLRGKRLFYFHDENKDGVISQNEFDFSNE